MKIIKDNEIDNKTELLESQLLIVPISIEKYRNRNYLRILHHLDGYSYEKA